MVAAGALIVEALSRNTVVIIGLILLDTALQFAVRSLLGRRSFALETASVFIFIFIGAVLAGLAQPGHFFPGMALYLASAMVYLEAKSIFSRGYSIRILVDLLEREHPQTLNQLKDNYSGKGLRWMLDKRIQALKFVWILRYDKDVVGPPTVLGRLIAKVGDGSRRLLKLEQVG